MASSLLKRFLRKVDRIELATRMLKLEENELTVAALARRRERDQQEVQIDQELLAEKREGSNWLENREMRVSALILEQQRNGLVEQIEIRKRLGQECPRLLSDPELSKLEQRMIRSLQIGRQARREDYERRASAAGIRTLRSPQRDAGAYGDLEAFVRRELRQLALSRSLGRLGGPKPTRLKAIFKSGSEWGTVG